MGDQGNEVIQTKLSPPTRSHPWIALAQLDDVVGHLLDAPLTVVTAPAGFGKTTQLAGWHKALGARGVATAWLTLDADDNDIHQFVSCLLEALPTSCAEAVTRARELIRNDPLLPYRQVLSALLNAIGKIEGPLVLFLDDFHLLESAEVNDATFRFVRYAPPNLHVVVAGRSEPMIHVSQFQSQRRLFRLDTDDLRFSEEDTARFFREVAGQPLGVREVKDLWRATEGWVTGLQLASIARLSRNGGRSVARGLRGGSHEISAYLTENVLASMPERLVDFMLRISVLDRVSAPLAERTTEFADAAALLQQVEQRNLFLAALDEHHEWYRFHALFLDYLRARAGREIPRDLATLHNRASEFFAEAGSWQEAVRHALAAGEDRKAAEWVERCAMDLIHGSALRTVIAWLGKLPERVIAGSLRLRLAQAWAFSLGLRPRDAVRTLASLEDDLSTGRLANAQDDDLKCEILSVRAITAGLTDDSTLSLRLARQVLALRPEPGSWVERISHTALVFGLAYDRGFGEAAELRRKVEAEHDDREHEPTYAGVYQQCMFGLSALVEGRLLEAEAAFSAAFARGEGEVGAESAAATLPAGYLSTVLYEWDELERLEDVLRGRFSTALEVAAAGSVSRFSVAQIRLQALRGKRDQAFRTIERASAVARERGWQRLLSACQAEAIRLLLEEGAIVRANRSLDVLLRTISRRPPSPLGSFVEVRYNVAMSMARVMLKKGLAEDAVCNLADLCDELAGLGCEYMLANARILESAALVRCGRHEAANRAIVSALLYGQRNGMIRGFLDAEPEIAVLLAHLADEASARPRIDAWYIGNLSSLISGAGRPAVEDAEVAEAEPAASATIQVLSPREREILVLLGSGLSNKAIARQLELSPETIKWHFKNIFRKLAVNSRVQAVRWAQENLPGSPAE